MKGKNLFDKIGIQPKQILYLLAANLFYALALDLFYVHNGIAAGGLAGIGTVLNSLFDLPVGAVVFILNIPICIWGWKIKGKRYIITSLIAVALYSFIVDVLSFLPSVTDDKLVAVICGGLLYGVAASFSVKAQISAGGTDLLAKLVITKLKSFSLGTLLMMIDGSIVVLAMLAYGDIGAGIYALLAIAVASIVTDKINSGFNRADIFYIFANRNLDEIADAILYDMGRGATCLEAKGMFEKSERKILMVVVKPNEMPKLKSIVKKYDPTAFIILTSAFEIIGGGFDNLDLTATVQDVAEKE
ncbi:MAG: YitT family protein [Anaerovoracaceae bacterium]